MGKEREEAIQFQHLSSHCFCVCFYIHSLWWFPLDMATDGYGYDAQ